MLLMTVGIDPESDAVTWEETISDNREPFLQEGEVDLVIASYKTPIVNLLEIGLVGAVLYHALNHAFFKSLLFLATGSVLHAYEAAPEIETQQHGDEQPQGKSKI